MKKDIPTWAMKTASPEDYSLARDAHSRGLMRIKLPDHNALRGWAKQQGWPTPWFGFEDVFITKMLQNEENFALAINESGTEIHIPKRDYIISTKELMELDSLYEERSDGRPVYWGKLVEELRDIRRAVEAGVVVQVEGAQELRSWQDFYAWAHGRYYMLEDGYDSWIGDDNS